MNRINYFFIAFLLLAFSNANSQVVINEILTSNTTVNTDEDGTYQDWVELYNAGATAINLNGYGLSDDAALPLKWVFPNVTMAANSYLLIWCSDKNRTVVGQPLHSNFKISSSGEMITLSNASGTVINSVPSTVLPSNVSYGRIPNGTGSFSYIQIVTPAAANGTVGYSEVLPPPTFSQPSGFQTAAFSLILSTTVPGATIIYTTDGSEPDAANLGGTTYNYRNVYAENPGDTEGPILQKSFQSFSYSTPVSIVERTGQANKISMINPTYQHAPTFYPTTNIFKGTVVRAKVVKAGALSSSVASKTYFVTALGNSKFSLPVISIGITESKLFDRVNGIYVAGKDWDDWRDANPTTDPAFQEFGNYYLSGITHEKEANFTYLVNGVEVVNQNVGLRIHGGESSTYEDKSFNVYARSDYGSDKIDYKFFNDLAETNFDRLVFRNSGGDFHNTMFRDALNHSVVKSLRCITESYQPTVAFINGEYWGLLNIREKNDNNLYKRLYGIDGADLDLLENSANSPEYIESGDNVDYMNMIAYVTSNSLISTANYDYIKTRLDPDNFMDYYIANIYQDNGDWPGTNQVFWRKRTAFTPNAPYGQDGRWRWSFHDMDDTYGVSSDSYNRNSLAAATAANGPAYPNPPASTLLLRKMLENASFKNDFINRFADLMNTTFLPSRVVPMLNAMNNVILPEVPSHLARWNQDPDVRDFYVTFETNFANQRPTFQRNHIRTKFGIASNITATLNVDNATHGYIKMNTIDVKDGTDGIVGNPYPWNGIYFSGIPVKLKAVAKPGFVFSNWTGASSATTEEITITPTASFSVTAVFVPTVVETTTPIYYWMMNGAMANNVPLETFNSTFAVGSTEGLIQYQSCLVGYPFTAASPNWRHASMERRNSPTAVNYIPEANGNLAFANSDMKGMQIKEPLENAGLGNTMIFNFSTTGYKNIKFSFAAINELTGATGILVDYAVNAGTPVWITTGLATTTLPLTAAFQANLVDFTTITAANSNENFKVRLRFTGANMTADAGNRITFNNFAVQGTALPLAVDQNQISKFTVYPNPTNDIINIGGTNGDVSYKMFSIEGKLVQSGKLNADAQISVSGLTNGLYLMQITSEGRIETKKIVKQ